MPIYLHNEDHEHFFSNTNYVTDWLMTVILKEDRQIGELNYIFCSDDYVLDINKTYLQHDYYTDVITFDNSDSYGLISGDIFISIDRVKENADNEKSNKQIELCRVMVHGLLHLIGYLDKEKEDKTQMTLKEDTYLSLLKK